jgi:DNA-binding NarL/FixJ family response regulator
VLLADDHPSILRALQRTLRTVCDVVGEVSSGGQVLGAVEELAPEVVVLDLSLPEMSGLDLCPLIKTSRPQTKIIILTAIDDAEIRAEAMRLGASALVLKNLLAVDLVACIHRAVLDEAEHVRSDS